MGKLKERLEIRRQGKESYVDWDQEKVLFNCLYIFGVFMKVINPEILKLFSPKLHIKAILEINRPAFSLNQRLNLNSYCYILGGKRVN